MSKILFAFLHLHATEVRVNTVLCSCCTWPLLWNDSTGAHRSTGFYSLVYICLFHLCALRPRDRVWYQKWEKKTHLEPARGESYCYGWKFCTPSLLGDSEKIRQAVPMQFWEGPSDGERGNG